MIIKKVFTEFITILLVSLFLYTALSKFLDFKGFVYDMNNQPFPDSLTPILVWSTPFFEIGIVTALVFKTTREVGFFASTLLMGLFTIYTAMVMLNGFAYIPCSCGGIIKHLTWPQHLVFNMFFLVISFVGIRLNRRYDQLRIMRGQAT
ncbi:MauE/DoxX family redox-associated membrane protein [Flavobacterium sp. RHBU_24]|uniref:MauE/DoxX family redox-associated membrane protein n=1 Tax=Flavobacterium sp. RHBU_24 TaxID=3391185 RepID=UPI003984F5E5